MWDERPLGTACGTAGVDEQGGILRTRVGQPEVKRSAVAFEQGVPVQHIWLARAIDRDASPQAA